jgi:quercetin dioxygenase-like cupin family protein
MTIVNTKRQAKGNKRLFLGSSIIDFKLLSAETNDAAAVIDITIAAGTEPARHVHEREDEIVMVREGRIVYFIGDTIKEAVAGDVVFAPRGIPHHFRVLGEQARVTLTVTPGGFEKFFWELSVPFDGIELPEERKIPTADQIAAVKWLSEKFGVTFLD